MRFDGASIFEMASRTWRDGADLGRTIEVHPAVRSLSFELSNCTKIVQLVLFCTMVLRSFFVFPFMPFVAER